MKIAVVGAPGSGKSSLVTTLRLALRDCTSAAAYTVSDNNDPCQCHSYDLTLLMGLDLLQQPTNISVHAANIQQVDTQLRQALDKQSIAYAVIYGSGQARTDCALQAVEHHRKQTRSRPQPSASVWQWCCDTCSDADSELRLFTALVNERRSVWNRTARHL